MKVNLLYDNPEGVRSGYVNLDPFSPGSKVSFLTLREQVDPGSCEEVVAHNILPFLSVKEVALCVNEWSSLLTHGGRMTLSAVDVVEVMRLTYLGSLPIEEINLRLYGQQDRPWRYHRSAHSVMSMTNLVAGVGLKVVLKRIENGMAVVIGERK